MSMSEILKPGLFAFNIMALDVQCADLISRKNMVR